LVLPVNDDGVNHNIDRREPNFFVKANGSSIGYDDDKQSMQTASNH
jgi:hypothetical protein